MALACGVVRIRQVERATGPDGLLRFVFGVARVDVRGIRGMHICESQNGAYEYEGSHQSGDHFEDLHFRF